jgi:hypothetical protein
MTSQGSIICKGTPEPNIFLQQRLHVMRWIHFINDFQEIPKKLAVCWSFHSLIVATYLQGLESNEGYGILPPKVIWMLFSI